MRCSAHGRQRLIEGTWAGDQDESTPNVCRHCGHEISASSVSMDGNHTWKHDRGGYTLCIINGTRPGTHAEL